MKRQIRFVFLLVLTATLLSATRAAGQTAACAWYQAKDSVCQEKIDLLYLVSTEVVAAKDDDGREVYRARLTAEDRQAIDAELAYVEEHIGQHDFNYFAPYYHQFTFNAIQLPDSLFRAEYGLVAEEVCRAFDHYMAHMNQGRRFVLAGFSQGAMLVLDLLKHMTDRQYEQLVAAYALGYRIAAEDERCSRIIPATDATTPGVTVSFNSVLSKAGRWPLVTGGAVTGINLVNWKTDGTPATFTYEGSLHTVRLDPDTHLLTVETDKADDYRQWNGNPVFRSAGVHPDCLHHWDLLFYTPFIHDNILQRAKSRTTERKKPIKIRKSLAVQK